MDNKHIDAIAEKLYCFLNKSGHIQTIVDPCILQCPVCGDKMEPNLLQTAGEGPSRKQKICWTCRGVKTRQCIFPLNQPPEVFWVERIGHEIDQGFIPLPRLSLLPKNRQYLYPQVFPNAPKRSNLNTPVSGSSMASFPNFPSTNQQKRMHASFKPIDLLNQALSKANSERIKNKTRPNPRPYRSIQRRTSEDYEPKMDHILYTERKHKKVDVFPNREGALETMINIRYSKNKFISNINSEMCRKNLIIPTPSLNQKQKKIVQQNKDLLNDVLKLSDLKEAASILATIPGMEASENYKARVGILPAGCHDEPILPIIVDSSASSSSSHTAPKPKTPSLKVHPGFKSTGDEEMDALIMSEYKKVMKSKVFRKRRKAKLSRQNTPIPPSPSQPEVHNTSTITNETSFADTVNNAIAEHHADLGLDNTEAWDNMFSQDSMFHDNEHDLEF